MAADWQVANRVARRAVEHSLREAKRVLETAPKGTAAPRPGYRRQTAVR